MAKFILYKNKVIEQYNSLNKINARILYSVKTNPLLAPILEHNTDSEFNCSSLKEANLVNDKSRIWYHSQLLDNLDLIFSLGIRKFVVEDLHDLDLLIDYIQKNNHKIDLLLRMKLKENTIFTGRFYVFGMESKIVNEKIKELRGNRNINKIGIHFHRKSQNVSEWSLKHEIKDSITEETLKNIDFLNIGGGLPINYKNSRSDILSTIIPKLIDLVSWLKGYNIETIIEPGRYISGPSVELETEIKKVSGRDIIVDCSVYNTTMDTLIVPIKLIVKNELEKAGKSYVIKGCTPCSMDIFRYDIKLQNPKVGDKLIFINAGAYNFATDFCMLNKIETIVL
ncbi:MAG: decarboxylase [Candidatus Nanoarchaeia archaeon]|nr:decarboxylase [Candidatus Nanoarchaeia archaeon]